MEGRWPVKVQPLPWYGGKQGYGKAAWICGLLPWEKESTYVEPFGGMASVLVTRAPVKHEIYNDLDGRIVNWWRVLRDKPEEFGWKVQCTPMSRIERELAYTVVDDENASDIDRALAFHIMVQQTPAQNMNRKKTWRMVINANTGTLGRWKSERVSLLAERLFNVQLECRPADEFLERFKNEKHCTMYCDPPYYSTDVEAYDRVETNIKELSALFLAQQCKVAISGYSGEWNHLGWQRHEMQCNTSVVGLGYKSEPRTEVLWTNYDAHSEQAIGGLFA